MKRTLVVSEVIHNPANPTCVTIIARDDRLETWRRVYGKNYGYIPILGSSISYPTGVPVSWTRQT